MATGRPEFFVAFGMYKKQVKMSQVKIFESRQLNCETES